MDVKFSRQCFGPAWRFDEPAEEVQFEFKEGDHPRHAAGASRSRGGEFAKKGTNVGRSPRMNFHWPWSRKPSIDRRIGPPDPPTKTSFKYEPHKITPLRRLDRIDPPENYTKGTSQDYAIDLVNVARFIERPEVANDVTDYERRAIRSNHHLENIRRQVIERNEPGWPVRVPPGEESEIRFDIAFFYRRNPPPPNFGELAGEWLSAAFSNQVAASVTLDIRFIDGESAYLAPHHDGHYSIYIGSEIVEYEDPERIIVHEFGHAMGMLIPEVKRMCIAFLARRNNGGSPDISSFIPGFPDDFEKTGLAVLGRDEEGRPYHHGAYTGSVNTHAGGETEILSRGLEYLYFNAAAFAEIDPEYFKFVVGIMHGVLLRPV